MKSIKNKLLLIFMGLSILPVLVTGTLSYTISTNALLEKLNHASLATLEQINKNVDNKVQKVLNYMDIFFTNEQLQRMLTEVDFSKPTGNVYMAHYQLDPMIGSLFYKDEDIICAVFLPFRGGHYIYKGYIGDPEALRETDWYRQSVDQNGQVLWAGIIDNPDRLSESTHTFLVSRLIKDVSFTRNLEPLGVAAVLLKSSIFTDIYSGVDLGEHYMITILDENGNQVMRVREDGVESLDAYPFKEDVLSQKNGYFRSRVNGRDTMVTFYTSGLSGWKILCMIPYQYFVKDIYAIAWATAIISVLCIIVIIVLAALIASRISKPIRQVVTAMKEVGRRNFEVSVPVVTQDEIGMISEGFNAMVQDINRLFHLAIEQEKSKREAQVRALQYQINPHFLYNTLSSIRFAAVMEKAENVSEMLQVLSRLLRNTINKNGLLVAISEEIANLKDYIYIQQIRYKRRIQINYQVDADIARFKVPNMLLQPIVENAIEHGLSKKLSKGDEECLIEVLVYKKDRQVCFEIRDNGVGMSEKEILDAFNDNNNKGRTNSVHIGIKNIHDRIRIQFGPDYGMSIESKPDCYTLVRLSLPIIPEGKGETYAEGTAG